MADSLNVKTLFSDVAITTVSSGGTTAPAAGTVETWTVASSSSFPAAQNTSAPHAAFMVVDPAAPTEWMHVTNVSGTTWTVVRGSEGATVAHSTGFTVELVVTAGWLNGIENAYPVLNPLRYGAKGDGTTDDTTALSNVLAMIPSSGGAMIIPPGYTFLVSSPLTVPANTTVMGAGASSILLASSSAAAFGILTISGSDVRICDLKLDGNSNANGTSGITMAASTTFNRVSVERCHFTRCTHVGFETLNTDVFYDLRFVDNVIHDQPVGVYIVGNTATPGEGVVVSRNVFHTLTPSSLDRALQIDGRAQVDTWKRVVVSENVFAELNAANCIPMEITGCTDVTISGNSIGPSGSRGISTGWCKQLDIIGNTVDSCQIYAIELNAGTNISITGNTVINCDTFVTPSNTTTAVTDVTISGNTILSNGYGNAVGNSIFVQYGALRWSIEGNTWRDSKSSSNTGVIRIGNGSDTPVDITVRDNRYFAVDSAADVNFVTIRSGHDIHVARNHVNIERAVSTALNTWAVVYLSAVGLTNCIVQENLLKMTGTLTATAFDGIDDGQAASYSSSGWEIRRNTCIGFNYGLYFLNNTSTELYIDDNDTQRCLSADQLNIASRNWNPPNLACVLASNYTTSSTTLSSSNLRFSIGANETWYVEVRLLSSKATSSTGMTVAVGAPTGATVEGVQELGGATFATALTASEITAINSASSAFATGIGVKVPSRMWFKIASGSTAGTVAIQFATVTSNTATVYAGSSLIATMARAQ